MAATPASSRQTLSYLRQLFLDHDIHPKSKLGQNFLIDLNLLQLLARTGDVSGQDMVVEVGTGTGSLTAHMASQAAGVLTIEIDSKFAALAAENLAGMENVQILNADIWKNKNRLNPEVLEALDALRARCRGSRLKLVANLPYVVATPVISNFLLSELLFERMVVTVQWEIAERLTARPGIKAYAALSVLVQSLTDVEIVRRLPPEVFWPRPQVESAIVLIRPNPAKRATVGNVLGFRQFLRALYIHRRKNLRGALASLATDRSKAAIAEILAGLGLKGTARAEELDLEQHLCLFRAFG